MQIFTIILAVLGLSVFEAVNSVDNAIINAEILGSVKPKARRWFLLWGFLFAVIVVRGLLPWLIIWLAAPGLGPWQAFTAAFSGNPLLKIALIGAEPQLFAAAGMFLIFLFFSWLFLEPKHFGLPGEKFFQQQGAWFFATVSLFLAIIVHAALKISDKLAFALVLGSTAFFVTHGFKQNAESNEQKLRGGHLSDISKLLYLEIIDAVFSIDGVLGAFAFTVSVPLILLGNGLGAYVVRRLTVANMENIKKYRYLKNGAMYSILFLGCIMLLNAFGFNIPEWVSPVVTFIIVGYFFVKSKKYA